MASLSQRFGFVHTKGFLWGYKARLLSSFCLWARCPKGLPSRKVSKSPLVGMKTQRCIRLAPSNTCFVFFFLPSFVFLLPPVTANQLLYINNVSIIYLQLIVFYFGNKVCVAVKLKRNKHSKGFDNEKKSEETSET